MRVLRSWWHLPLSRRHLGWIIQVKWSKQFVAPCYTLTCRSASQMELVWSPWAPWGHERSGVRSEACASRSESATRRVGVLSVNREWERTLAMWARSAPYFNFNTRHPVDFLWCLYLRSSPNSLSSLMLTLELHQLAALCSLRLCVAEAGVEVCWGASGDTLRSLLPWICDYSD